MDSRAASGEIHAEMDARGLPSLRTLQIRFRHPQGKPMHSATVNGDRWNSIDRDKEWVIIANPTWQRYSIVVHY